MGTDTVIGVINYDTTTYFSQGGLVDVSIAQLPASVLGALDTGDFFIQSDTLGKLMLETPYMIASDQNEIYAEQGDTSNTYRNDDPTPEPCSFTILKKGKPLQSSDAFNITCAGNYNDPQQQSAAYIQ